MTLVWKKQSQALNHELQRAASRHTRAFMIGIGFRRLCYCNEEDKRILCLIVSTSNTSTLNSEPYPTA